jgi:hypothetical protein
MAQQWNQSPYAGQSHLPLDPRYNLPYDGQPQNLAQQQDTTSYDTFGVSQWPSTVPHPFASKDPTALDPTGGIPHEHGNETNRLQPPFVMRPHTVPFNPVPSYQTQPYPNNGPPPHTFPQSSMSATFTESSPPPMSSPPVMQGVNLNSQSPFPYPVPASGHRSKRPSDPEGVLIDGEDPGRSSSSKKM